VSLEEGVGKPILWDLDGDMRADILVPVMDGNPHAFTYPIRRLALCSWDSSGWDFSGRKRFSRWGRILER